MAEHTAENDKPVKATGLVRIDSWKIVCQECYDGFENHMGWSIFADHGYAEEQAQDSDWLVRNGLTLCPSCWEKRPCCRDENNECVRRDVTEADDGWLYCPEHIEQGMDTGDTDA